MSKSMAAEELQLLAVTKTSEIWKSVASVIMTIVDEAAFEAGSAGLTFRSMDPSHIALIDLNWPNSTFEKYECPATIKFGLKISDFAKIIKRSGSNDSMEIRLRNNSLNIKTSGSYVRNYKMNLIESADANASPLPKLSFDSKIVIGTSVLDKILTDIQVMSDNVSIETVADKQTLTFTGTADNGNATVMIDDYADKKNNTENKLLLQEITVKETSKATYNMDYILKIVKSLSSASDNITLEYSSKKPLRLEFILFGSLKMQFFLAPRVDS
jgi:proliferating cell nuclear antigen